MTINPRKPTRTRATKRSSAVPADIVPPAARILIVDDKIENRKLLREILSSEGYTLISVSSGEEALASIRAEMPDLVLLDFIMPGMDGAQVASEIKGDLATRNIPVIMLTALDDRESRVRGLSAGAEDFLITPVDRIELCMRVRNLLRLKAYGEYYDRYSQVLEGEVLARTAALVEHTERLEEHAVALRRSDERTNYALGAARMGIWEVDVRTDQVTWSASMTALFGLEPDRVPVTSGEFVALIHPADQQLFTPGGPVRSGNDFNLEFRVVWPDGATHWLAGRGRMVRDDSGAPVRLSGVGTDITEHKSLEAQLRQAQKMEVVGQLAGGLAHDFNNMLTAILGYANLVMETLAPTDPRCADMEEVIGAGQRASALTRQLLAFSRNQVLHTADVDLNALVERMRPMLGRLIGEDVLLVSELAADLDMVLADAGQIEQVLMNLVVNARDALPTGGRVVVATANIELAEETFMHGASAPAGAYVMLSITDGGEGMDEQTLQHLFEPFFTTKDPGKGTGLGLATAYGIVKQSGGYFAVESRIGAGATFKVYLPRPARIAVPVHAPAGGTETHSETILVIDEDLSVRLLTRTILERAGYSVIDAPNSALAEKLASNGGRIDLLITDEMLLGADGTNLFQRLQRTRPELKVLYVSGSTRGMPDNGSLDQDIQQLTKPFTPDALNHRVREIFGR